MEAESVVAELTWSFLAMLNARIVLELYSEGRD